MHIFTRTRLFMCALALGIACATAGPALASCRTHTYILNGKVVTCSTCCYGNGNCTTNCF